MSRRLMTIGGLALGVVLLLALNMASSTLLAGARLDLTENKLYTLSQGTRNIIGSLQEPVNLRLFLSRKQAIRLPGISSYAQRVEELLRQYERDSNEKIRLSVIDPEPFSEEEDRAVAYGLRGVSMDDGEGVLYFGLVGTSSTDDQEVIPFFSPTREELLEHDITKLVYQLADPKKRVIGLLSTLPIDSGPLVPGQGGNSWVVVDQLRQLFEVRSLETDIRSIPDDVDVLMIVHPRALGDQTLYAIDQFILSGGRAVVYVDPNPESERSAGGMLGGAEPGASDLSTLFDQWGIELVKDKIAADIRFAERVRYN
ncbi:MAG: GldG family protein, partial [Anaerolineales bacterium]|nr:GldG family protein [Anaerolineales bacterium]